VACEAQFRGAGLGEFYAGYIFISADFMAARATGRDGGVNGLSLRFLRVTFNAFRRIGILIQGDRMGGSRRQWAGQKRQEEQPRELLVKGSHANLWHGGVHVPRRHFESGPT